MVSESCPTENLHTTQFFLYNKEKENERDRVIFAWEWGKKLKRHKGGGEMAQLLRELPENVGLDHSTHTKHNCL